MADDKLGRKIISDLQKLSEPFGTTIEFKGGVGVVRIPREAATES